MKTMSIKVEAVDKGIRARIIVSDKRRNSYEAWIKEPFSEHPFYFLDGVRHDLTEHEKKRLRELIEEAKNV